MKKRPAWLRILLKAVGWLLTFVLMALACVSLILARPEEKEDAVSSPQPLLSASPAVSVSSETDLPDILRSFPVPVMSFMSGSGMTFVSATSSDAALDGGFGRVVTMYWQTGDGQPVTLQSIYPASAFSLLSPGDYHFSRTAGPTLSGIQSVRMESGTAVRVHAASDSGLYAVIIPLELAPELSAISRSLQIYTLEQ